MVEWHIKKMEEAHNNKQWEDRANYAKMARVDFVKYFYLNGYED